jgi:arylsulfatase A-like enzyme
VEQVVRTIDIVPTVLQLAGVEKEAVPPNEGRSLVPLTDAKPPAYDLVAYCDSVNTLTYGVTPNIRDVKDEMLFALIRGSWKYIHSPGSGRDGELYNLAADPGERTSICSSHPGLVEQLRADLISRKCIPAGQLPLHGRMSAEDVERLRALGYLDE